MRSILALILIVCILGLLYILLGSVSVEDLKVLGEEHRILGAVLFGLIMCSATVVAPITVLPFIPMLAPFLGPFTTGLASFFGWTLGALISFWIARRYGRPVVQRFVSLETLELYEKRIDEDTSFLIVLLLRMVLPVDILSYALGLFSTISWRSYTLATMLGVMWFSFAFAYLGDSLISGNYVLLAIIGVASSLVIVGSWYGIRKMTQSKDKI